MCVCVRVRTCRSKEPLGKVMLDRESIINSPRGWSLSPPPPPLRFSVLLVTGLDKWFPLMAATKHDEVQGEVLVEIMLTEQGTGHDHMKALITVVEAR